VHYSHSVLQTWTPFTAQMLKVLKNGSFANTINEVTQWLPFQTKVYTNIQAG